MSLAVLPADAAAAARLLADAGLTDHRPLVMLNPAASYGVSKIWAPQRFAALADALIDRHDAGVILNAAPAERHVAETVAASMTHAPHLNLADVENTIGHSRSARRSPLAA